MVIEGKTISLYIPPGIQSPHYYPLLIFTDGQTCFGNTFNSLELQELADSLIKLKLIDPVFIAGIHSDQERLSQYIPYPDSSIFQDFGYYEPQSESFVGFIKTALLPTLQSRFPISKKTGIAGFSFGGLFAAWAAIHHNDVFSFAAAFSPSMWVADFRVFNEASLLSPAQHFYMDIGTAEWNYYLPFVKSATRVLGGRMYYYEVIGGAHMIAHVKSRVHNALLLFNGRPGKEKYSWQVETEVIESMVQPGRFYLRLNPVIEYKNGLKHSLFYQATFRLLNPEAGVVNEDGSFRFLKEEDLIVVVNYMQEEKKIIVRYKDVVR